MVLFSALVFGCREEKLAELRFCADVRPDNPCFGEDTEFVRNTNVWAQLLLKEGFRDTAVVGKLYGLKDGEWEFIETKVHRLDQGQTIVMEAIFLNLCGNFMVEFYDTGEKLLARKEFEIW